MKPVSSLAVCTLCLWSSCSAQATVAPPAGGQIPTDVTLAIRLKDGSRISGQPLTPSLAFRTAYAQSELPWRAVTDGEFPADDKPAVLKLTSGDRLSGRMKTDKLLIATPLGKLLVPVAAITALQVQRKGAGIGAMEGLVLYFPFDEDSGDIVRDASGNGNDGKVTGARYTPAGRIGGAYAFRGGPDSGDFIVVSNSPSLNTPCETKQITLAVWIKPDSLPFEFPDVFCKGGNQPPAAHGGYEVYLNSHGDNDVCFSSGFFNFYPHHANGKWVNHHLGEWIHLAVTLDVAAGKRCLYVNGAPTGDEYDDVAPGRSLADALAAVPNDLYIGAPDPRHHPNRAWFDGLIDEVMIFNRALSAEEVVGLYRRESTPVMNADAVQAAVALSKLPARVEVDLVDGSRLAGELSLSSVDLQSASLGKVTIPVRLIRTLQFAAEGKPATATLITGDVVNGQPVERELQIATSFGHVTLTPAQIRRLTLTAAPAGTAASSAAALSADAEQLGHLLAGLENSDQAQREKALRALVQIGAPALPALKTFAAENQGSAAWWAKAAIQEIESKKKDQ